MKTNFFKKSIQQLKKWCRGTEKDAKSTQPSTSKEEISNKVISLDTFISNKPYIPDQTKKKGSYGKDTTISNKEIVSLDTTPSSEDTTSNNVKSETTTFPTSSEQWEEIKPPVQDDHLKRDTFNKSINHRQPGDLYKKVAEIPIIDVLMFYGFYTGKKPNRGAINIHCPLPNHQHQSSNPRKQGSMRIDLAANKATCWSSHCSHHKKDFKNCMSLMAAIRGDKNQQFVKHLIAKDFGIISEETFNRFLSGETIETYEVQESTCYIPHQQVEFFEELAPVETIDLVIRALMSTFRAHCGFRNDAKYGLLSPEDFDYLAQERNLSEDFIREGYYFTFPSENFFPTFVEVLLKNKIISNKSELNTLLKGVPGFYFNNITQEWSYATLERNGRFVAPRGIGIPIQNANKKFTGIQIRKRFVAEGGNRYSWHTSKYFVGDEFSYGISPGTPVSVVFPKKIKRKTLFITEGHFKAKRIADTFNCIAISVQGVANFKGIEKEIKTLIHEQKLAFNHILIAYDADIAGKKEVLTQSKNLIEYLKTELQDELKQTNLLFVGWDITLGKGIDDVIESGNQHRLSRIPAETFLNACDEMFKAVGTMENWSEEERLMAFKKHVLSKFPNYEYLLNQKEPA